MNVIYSMCLTICDILRWIIICEILSSYQMSVGSSSYFFNRSYFYDSRLDAFLLANPTQHLN